MPVDVFNNIGVANRPAGIEADLVQGCLQCSLKTLGAVGGQNDVLQQPDRRRAFCDALFQKLIGFHQCLLSLNLSGDIAAIDVGVFFTLYRRKRKEIGGFIGCDIGGFYFALAQRVAVHMQQIVVKHERRARLYDAGNCF